MADASYASLQVQMTGPGAGDAALGGDADGRARAPRDASRSSANAARRRSTCRRTIAQITTTSASRTDNRCRRRRSIAPRTAIDALAAALPANGTEQSEAASTWQAATAAMEVVDTIELSLQKGRTIEVHQQRLTEQLAFRGTMAAFGCGLLLLMFFVLVVAGVVGDVLGVPLKDYLAALRCWRCWRCSS